MAAERCVIVVSVIPCSWRIAALRPLELRPTRNVEVFDQNLEVELTPWQSRELKEHCLTNGMCASPVCSPVRSQTAHSHLVH